MGCQNGSCGTTVFSLNAPNLKVRDCENLNLVSTCSQIDMNKTITIPGAQARAFTVNCGMQIQIVNLQGSQVVDAWAFCLHHPEEFMSTEHTRSCLEKLTPVVGDALYTNRRRAILRIIEDTSPGVHDLLLSACDIDRYKLLGVDGYHRNCADNLREALAEIQVTPPQIPSPFNILKMSALARMEIYQSRHHWLPPAKASLCLPSSISYWCCPAAPWI